MPTPVEVDQLRLTPGIPVIRIVRTMYDTDNAPVEVQVTVAAADRHSFRYEAEL
jgi:GntR family transcriptional regulator